MIFEVFLLLNNIKNILDCWRVPIKFIKRLSFIVFTVLTRTHLMIFLSLFLLNQADSLGCLTLPLDWYAILSIWLDLFASDWGVVPSFHDVIAGRLDFVPVADNVEFILDSIRYFLLSGLVETTEGFFNLPWILRIIIISTYDLGLWLVL